MLTHCRILLDFLYETKILFPTTVKRTQPNYNSMSVNCVGENNSCQYPQQN